MKIEQYNQNSNTQRDELVRAHLADLQDRKVYTLLYLSTYQSEQYGSTAYMDIEKDGKRTRLSIPNRYYKQIVSMTFDDDLMKDISERKCGVKVHPYKTKAGFTAYDITFVTL